MFDLNRLRTNPELAQNGAWVPYLGGSKLKVARINNKDAENYRLQKAIENADIIQAGGEEAERLSYEIETEMLANHILKDWQGISMGGKALKFTPEAAKEFLENPEFADFREDVLRISRSREHYNLKAEEEVAETVK